MEIRSSFVAGQFYPGSDEALHKEISSFFDAAKLLEIDGAIRAIIAPHAGYMFSGMMAARAYRQILGESRCTVCVISPSHQEYFPFLSIYDGDAYETPLGLLEIDAELREEAAAYSGIEISRRGHGPEHALEVQLPFLQKALKSGFRLLPMVMGMQTDESVTQVSELVAGLSTKYGQELLFVASTDLSHFHSYKKAQSLDQALINMLEKLDTEALWKALAQEKVEACGGAPMIAMLKGLKKSFSNLKIHNFGYMNSGDVISDKSRVVGYTSAILYT
jgi:MEMO1 family protein